VTGKRTDRRRKPRAAVAPASGIDAAWAAWTAGRADDAIRCCVAVLEPDPSQLGAAALLARALVESREAIAGAAAERLVDAFVRRGDLPRALAAIDVAERAGHDPAPLRVTVANAFGRGSRRAGDVAPAPPPLPPKEVAIDGATMDALYTAFLGILARADSPQAPPNTQHVRPDAYTVRAQMRRIRDVLAGKESVLFEELFTEHAAKMEIIVTFMALLEMIAHSEIVLHQKKPFAPIRISAERLLDDADEAYDYLDETDA